MRQAALLEFGNLCVRNHENINEARGGIMAKNANIQVIGDS